jgi:hypothetical protein
MAAPTSIAEAPKKPLPTGSRPHRSIAATQIFECECPLCGVNRSLAFVLLSATIGQTRILGKFPFKVVMRPSDSRESSYQGGKKGLAFTLKESMYGRRLNNADQRLRPD